MSFGRAFRRACAAAVLAAAAALVWGGSDEAAVVLAQQPGVACDQDWSRVVTGRVNCFVDPRTAPGHPVPPPGGSVTNVGNFRAGAEYWDYRLRVDARSPLLYCSASTPVPGPEPAWRAEAVGGAIRIGELDYGRARAPAGSDRLVETFWGGRTDTRRWSRRSRYDREGGRWRAETWEVEGTRSADADEERAGLAAGSPGASCPEDGLLVNRLVTAGRLLGGCMAGSPAGEHWIHDGGRLRGEARYRPRGQDGEEEDNGEDDDEEDDGEEDDGDPPTVGEDHPDHPRFDGHRTAPALPADCDLRPGAPDCDVCQVDPLYCEWRDLDENSGGDGNPGQGPETGDGGVDDSPGGGVGDVGDGTDYQDGAGVVAVRHNLACLELNAWEVRERVVVETVNVYDPACDLVGNGLRDPSCDLRGLDTNGNRQEEQTRRELYWARLRGPENVPWARVFWEGLPSEMGAPFGSDGAGGVVMGQDGSGYCLLRQGLVPNPALPGVVPSVSRFLAGVWAEPFRGAVAAVCPSQEDSFAASVTVAGAGTFGAADAGFGVQVSVDHAPEVGQPGLDEDRSQADYRAMRPCSDHPDGATGCGGAFASSDARRQRLAAAERLIGVEASRGNTRSWSVGKDVEVVAFDWRLADTFNRPHVDGVDRVLALETAHADAGGDFGSATSREARVLAGPWFGCGSLAGTVFGDSDSLMSWWKGRGADLEDEQLDYVAALQPLADAVVAAETEAEREVARAAFEAVVAERYREARADTRGICG